MGQLTGAKVEIARRYYVRCASGANSQSRRVTINLENGQVKTFWYAYVLNILLLLYTRTYPRKLEVK